jgi:thiamine pyrophosphate-dependent acetolactate synthase large subunit-like protein
LNAPVIDKLSRMNMPNHHPLCHTLGGGATLRQADVVLVLEPADLFSTLYDMPDIVDSKPVSRLKPGARVINIGIGQTGLTKSNLNAFMRYAPTDLVIEGDAEATMPSLIEAVGIEMAGPAKDRATARGQKLRDMGPRFRQTWIKNAANGWDASPISTARTCMELWDQIKGEDWSGGAITDGMGGWATALWDFNKPYHWNGGMGGGGAGYHSPATVGAALANKGTGRLTIGMVGDGDFNMAPGVIWTAQQSQIPLLMIVQNNGGYHQEVMHLQRMADQRSRKFTYGDGCTFDHPTPNYAKMAQAYGCYAEGPVSNPRDLGPAIKRALAVVKKGEPALIDVVSQPR